MVSHRDCGEGLVILKQQSLLWGGGQGEEPSYHETVRSCPQFYVLMDAVVVPKLFPQNLRPSSYEVMMSLVFPLKEPTSVTHQTSLGNRSGKLGKGKTMWF